MHQLQRRIFSIVAAGVLTAGVMPAPAAADTVVSESGVTGAHSLVDRHAVPGAFCLYDAIDGGLRKVRSPACRRVRGSGRQP